MEPSAPPLPPTDQSQITHAGMTSVSAGPNEFGNTWSQRLRFGFLIASLVLVCLFWASPLPVMLQHQSRRPVFAGYEADYLLLLSIYLFSIILIFSFAVLIIIKIIRGSSSLSQIRKLLVANIAGFLLVIIGIYILPRDTLTQLQKMAFVCITLQGGALLILWPRFRLRHVLIILALYFCLEVASFAFLNQNPGLARYLPQDISAEPVKPQASSVCLSGCFEQPGWAAFVHKSYPVYKDTVIHWSAPGWYDATHEYNNLGLRGPNTTYESAKYRILILGHSYVQQMQVDNKDTIGQQLQELLDGRLTEDGQEYEVLQLGLDYGFLGSSYQYYYHEGYKFEPDLVLHVSTGEISNANAPYFTPQRSNTVYAIDNDEVYTYRLPPTIPVFIQNYASDFGLTLYDLKIRTPLSKVLFLAPVIDRMLGWGVWSSSPTTYEDYIADEGINYSVQLLQDIVASWQVRLQQEGGDLAILRIWTHNSYLTGEPDNDFPTRINTDLLESFDVPVIDTMEHFSTVMQSGIDLDYYDEYQDNHFNVQGYHELAVVILDWLVEQGIVPVTTE